MLQSLFHLMVKEDKCQLGENIEGLLELAFALNKTVAMTSVHTL